MTPNELVSVYKSLNEYSDIFVVSEFSASAQLIVELTDEVLITDTEPTDTTAYPLWVDTNM